MDAEDAPAAETADEEETVPEAPPAVTPLTEAEEQLKAYKHRAKRAVIELRGRGLGLPSAARVNVRLQTLIDQLLPAGSPERERFEMEDARRHCLWAEELLVEARKQTLTAPGQSVAGLTGASPSRILRPGPPK